MNSRSISLVGVAAICALAFGAIPASDASAAGATGFTCVEKAGGANTDSHCRPGSSGSFGHVAIAAGKSTTLTLKALGNQVLGAEVFGAKVELIATGVECVGCSVENRETGGGTMEFSGGGDLLKYTGVAVGGTAGENCKVTEDGGLETSGVLTTKLLKFVGLSPSWAAFEPTAETTFATFKIITNPAKHSKLCNLVGTYTLSGRIKGTLDGATLNFNMSGIELRLNGEATSLKGETTLEAGEGAPFHAVAVTAT